MRSVVNPGTAGCGNSGDLLFYTWECNTATSREVMRINGRGRVGIGTASPSASLDVVGDLIASGNVGIGTSTPARKLTVNSPGYGIEHTDGTVRIGTYVEGSGGYFGTVSPHDLYFMVNDNSGAIVIRTNNNTEFFGGVTVGNTSSEARVFLRTRSGGYGFSHFDGTCDLATYVDGAGGWIGTVTPHRLNFYVNNGFEAMTINTDGNVGIGTTTPATKLDIAGEVTCTAVNITSDRNAKERFKPVNAREVLAKVARLPISEWQYKTQADARHIGPMAQDFREAFLLGRDEKHITSVDADGVALAAIQGLNEKVDERDARIHELEKTVAELKAIVNKLAAQNGGAR